MRNRRPFWEKVNRGHLDDCWPWTGYVGPSGHGATTYKSKPCYASRKAWLLSYGPIHGPEIVCHRCDNALCCNPAHLYLGTRADNMIDRFSKPLARLRQARGRRRIVTGIQLIKLFAMRDRGVSLKECARTFNVHKATICRWVKDVKRVSDEVRREDRLSNSRTNNI